MTARQRFKAAWKRHEASRWALAAAVVVFVHVAAALTFHYWKAEEPFSEPPAAPVMVDLAPFPVAPETPPIDIAPGPLMTQAAPSPIPEPAPEVPQTEKIPEIPVKEAEVTLPPPEKQPEPKPPEKREEKVTATPTEQKDKLPPAPQTTAPPRVVAPRAPRMAAPRIGVSTSNASNASWRSALVAHLNRFKQYPGEARSRGDNGTAMLQFSIDRSGRVLSYSISRSSGSAALDRATTAMIQRANPLPAPPADVGGSRFSFGIPVRFNIR